MPPHLPDNEEDWFKSQINGYKELLPAYKEYARVLHRILEGVAKQHAPMAIVASRPKSIASFAEKIQRKKHKYHDPVHQITDLCGGRVITRTIDDMEAVCRFIEDNFEIDWDNSVDVTQRLKPTEFGYRSIHYIVQFKQGIFPSKNIDVHVPASLYGLKAEIQVRTLLAHTLADFDHDIARTYKAPFKIPRELIREIAGVAAMLERVDSAFSKIKKGVEEYVAGYCTYMSEGEIQNEILLLETVLAVNRENLDLVQKIGRLAISIADWDKAIDILSPYSDQEKPKILRDLGIALCNKNATAPERAEFASGRDYLLRADDLAPGDLETLTALADSWVNVDEQQAREYYYRAFVADPTDSYSLVKYIAYEIYFTHDLAFIQTLKPSIEKSLRRCRRQADLGMNIPWVYYDMAKLYLFIKQPYASLAMIAHAIDASENKRNLTQQLQFLQLIQQVKENLPGFVWLRRLLLLSLAIRYDDPRAREEIERLKEMQHYDLTKPVIIVAGSCESSIHSWIEKNQNTLIESFEEFSGTIISGGTLAGASSLVGAIQERYPDMISSVGYLPTAASPDLELDKRYRTHIFTEGSTFSAFEPLQYWIDLVASGARPSDVRVLGIGGGTISAAEYRIALALGANVAILKGSRGEGERLINDADWKHRRGRLIHLPVDTWTIHAYINFSGMADAMLEEETVENIAQAIHADYLLSTMAQRHQSQPQLQGWDTLRDDFKHSNREQARHTIEKLTKLGYSVHKVEGRKPTIIDFCEDEIEFLAEMEHGRWNTERLLSGWSYGEEKDPHNKISPYIVEWSNPVLAEDIKNSDRDTMSKIPQYLAKFGMEIRRNMGKEPEKHMQESQMK